MRLTPFLAILIIAIAVSASPVWAAALTMPGAVASLGDNERTRQAIVDGMAVRNWMIEDERPGAILARIYVRGHTAKVWINYNESQVSFVYGGSDKLKCVPSGDSCSSIHKSYNSWVLNLKNDIVGVMSAERAVSPPGKNS